jgi:DnaJ-domain-containing protein 1
VSSGLTFTSDDERRFWEQAVLALASAYPVEALSASYGGSFTNRAKRWRAAMLQHAPDAADKLVLELRRRVDRADSEQVEVKP